MNKNPFTKNTFENWCLENNPSLLSEWDYNKNNPLLPSDITPKCRLKVFWICPNGHSFDAIVGNRVYGSSCPVCTGRKVLKGYNDFETWCNVNSSNLLSEWDYEKNTTMPSQIAPKSNKKCYWVCKKGHSFVATPNNRTNGTSCPICTGMKALPGESDFISYCNQNNLLLPKEWDYERNSINPTSILPQSHISVFWKCRKGHQWKARVQNRVRGAGCPYCSGLNIWKPADYISSDDEILREWDYSVNSFNPLTIKRNSSKKAFWTCPQGHHYEQSIRARIRGFGCPICSGNQEVRNKDFASNYPELAKMWDYEKNGFSPSCITAHSNKKCWWRCPNGHSFLTSVGYMTRNRPHLNSCPTCNKELKTSFPEQAIFFYCKQYFPETISQDNQSGIELDIFIPSLQTAIEYDGIRWHNSDAKLSKDNAKDSLCQSNGIRLFRFRDPLLKDTIYAQRITCKDGSDTALSVSIKELLEALGISTPNIDFARDSGKILSLFRKAKKENSLAAKYPSIATEWHPTKNGELSPEEITWGSGKKVWWKCNRCGTEWSCSPIVRTSSQKQGCPLCTRNTIRATKAIPVKNLDTGEVFSSIGEAALSCGGRGGDISTCCRGQQKSAFGYRWAYLIKGACPRKKYLGRIKNSTNGMVFDSLQAAALWCNGKVGNISACCKKRQRTAYGYTWEYTD